MLTRCSAWKNYIILQKLFLQEKKLLIIYSIWSLKTFFRIFDELIKQKRVKIMNRACVSEPQNDGSDSELNKNPSPCDLFNVNLFYIFHQNTHQPFWWKFIPFSVPSPSLPWWHQSRTQQKIFSNQMLKYFHCREIFSKLCAGLTGLLCVTIKIESYWWRQARSFLQHHRITFSFCCSLLCTNTLLLSYF